MRDYETSLVDIRWPETIKNLQLKQIKVLLLTACRGGKVGVVESMFELRRQQLLDVGIDFSKSWENAPSMNLMESEDPLFEKGIIFIGTKIKKGYALKMFLSKIQQYKFNNIIFIDDKIENIGYVMKMSNELGIEFVGVKYKKENDEILDINKAKKQLDILIKEEKWIPESEIH